MKKDLNEWHRHFAWLPVCIDGKWFWMTTVMRKSQPWGYDAFWLYRPL